MERTEQVPEWHLSEEELIAGLFTAEQELCRANARVLSLVGKIDERGVAASKGFRSTHAMLVRSLRISWKEARARVTQSTAVLPVMREALAAGEINREHTSEITHVLTQAPGSVTPEERARHERALVELARQARPSIVRKAGQQILHCWGLGEHHPDNREQGFVRPRREFRYNRTRDGRMRYVGEFDPEAAVLAEQVLTVLAEPDLIDTFGNLDRRTRSQRQGDAIAAVFDLAARTPDLPVEAAEVAAATVTISLEDLERRARTLMPDGYGPMSITQLRRMCWDAKVVPAVLNGTGEVLDLGRTARTVTLAQRRALALRDKGCTAPGCTRGPKWTTPHPVEHGTSLNYDADGQPDIADLALVCERDRRLVHHGGWEIRLRHGVAEWIPPAWLDLERRPLRNTAHDLPHTRAA